MREQKSVSKTALVRSLGIARSTLYWENGYQESFYGKFKLDFGDLINAPLNKESSRVSEESSNVKCLNAKTVLIF